MFTIGIEEEFQVIDPKTRRLVSHMTEKLLKRERCIFMNR